MAFELEWTSNARSDFHALLSQPGIEKLMAIKAVAANPHREWLAGRQFERVEFAGNDIRLLEVGNVGLVYALFESENRVRLLAILRNNPA